MQRIKREIAGLLSPLRLFDFQVCFVILSACVILIVTKEYGTTSFFRNTIVKALDLNMDREHIRFWAYEYRLLIRPVFQFALPLLLILWPLKKKPRDFGVTLGDVPAGLFWFVLSSVVMTAIIVPISQTDAFQRYYGKIPLIADSWKYFTIYALSYFFYMTGWEYIFKGYMLFGLEEKWGAAGAVLVQTIPFAMLHIGKPLPETLASVIAGVFLGLMALRTRSFWWGVFIHVYAIVLMYFMAVVT